MKLVSSVLLIITLLSHSFTFAQEYQAPLDFRMLLSGTFGELRGNHFHSGIDIKKWVGNAYPSRGLNWGSHVATI